MTADTPAAAPITAEREAFEMYQRNSGYEPRRTGKGYAGSMHDDWKAWLARAALSAPVAAPPAASGVDALWVEKANDLAATLASHEWSVGTLNALNDPAASTYRSLSDSARAALRTHLSTALPRAEGGNG